PYTVLRSEGGGITSSLGKAIFEQYPQRHDAVAPGDLLAFVVSPAVVGDGHFVDAIAPLEDLRGDLRLDAESVALELEGPQHFHPHRFVAGFHVRQDRVVEDVGEKGERAVAHVVRKQKDAAAAEETR